MKDGIPDLAQLVEQEETWRKIHLNKILRHMQTPGGKVVPSSFGMANRERQLHNERTRRV